MVATKKYARTRTRIYRLWTYDVWGNARDGYEVNDRYSHGEISIKCKLQVHNIGTEHEFATWEPTNRQLTIAVAGKRLSWEWQEHSYEAEDSKTGKPVGCLEFERFEDGLPE